VNADESPQPITLNFDTVIKAGNGTLLTNDDEYAFNYLNNATAISPTTFKLAKSAIKGKKVEYTVPGLAIVVLELK
jgi:alpha-N-arabinofuranosidase